MKADVSRIVDYMCEKDLSQSELADACGLTRSTVNAIIRKRRNPSIRTIGKIAGAIHCRPSEIIEGYGIAEE